MSTRPSSGASPLAGVLAGPAGLLADAGRAAWALVGSRRSGAKSCKDFASQAEAQAYFDAHGGSPVNNVDNLDHNRNGIACEVYPYGRSELPVPTWVRSGVRRLLVPGLVGALGWAAGRHRRPV